MKNYLNLKNNNYEDKILKTKRGHQRCVSIYIYVVDVLLLL